MLRWLVVMVMCTGCSVGGGPVVGYGLKRGFYAGAAGGAGIFVAHSTLELGGTKRGFEGQVRFDLELNKARSLGWDVETGRPSPGLHLGIGYARGEGAGGLAAVVGPDVAVMRDQSYCDGAPAVYVGVAWRFVRGESQFVLEPRYEQMSDICLR